MIIAAVAATMTLTKTGADHRVRCRPPSQKETRDGGCPTTAMIVVAVVDATSTTTGTIVVVTIAVVD